MIETTPSAVDEFYIGYEEQMPPGLRRFAIMAVALFAFGAFGALVVALGAQQQLPASRFEFGVVKPLAGVLHRTPYPWIDVDGRRVWLVGPGKFGAEHLLGNVPDGPLTVEGSAIERSRHHMVEVVRFTSRSQPTLNRVEDRSEHTLNRATLVGEIVDSKCFLGVMNPGEGTVHRDCARACLRGGIPPMLVVRDGRGREEVVLLVSSDGKPIGQELAAIAGRAVNVTGRLGYDGHDWVLYADAGS
jgi:hypothetical protein